MIHKNLAIADIVNCYNSLLDDYDYLPAAIVDRNTLNKMARSLAKQDFIIPDWQAPQALPKDNFAFISHTFYINVVNFGFRDVVSGENYRFNSVYRGSLGAAACFYRRFGERPISPQEIFSIVDSPDATKEFFRGENEMPMLTERHAMLREAARVVDKGFAGEPMNILEAARFSAEKIISLLINCFPLAYGSDYAFYEMPDGKRSAFFFNKRAQLWPLVYHGRASYSGGLLPLLRDPEYIGAISDPAVPSALRELAVMIYSHELVKKTAQKIPLESGGKEEVELRMATVYAVQNLLNSINYYRKVPKQPITMMELDYFLWTLGRASKLPRHLCRTTAY